MEQKLAVLQAKIEADQSLAEKLFAMETPEDVESLLKAEGLDFTLEEINMLREALIKSLVKGENGELSDEDLEDVSGGCIIFIISMIAALAASALTTQLTFKPRW